jgi:uncharacterized membrane protein
MSPRLLGGLLVLSLALNAFAIAGGVTVWRELKAVEARVAERLPPPQPSFRQAMGSLSPETRVRVREALRAAALAARPDFERAREARRQAIVRSGAAQLDRAAVFALLAESREAELRGRIRLEAAALDLFETLTPGKGRSCRRFSRGGSLARGAPTGRCRRWSHRLRRP